MSNDLTPHEPSPIEDDGFNAAFVSGRTIKGSFLKWNDSLHWLDRDGLVPPSPLLVIAINEILQMWRGGKAEIITEKPLPDPKVLNSAIPVSEWQVGPDKKPRPPWAHTVVVYLVNISTGEAYTYAAPTIGAHIAFDHLREAVTTMRLLRGTRCMPLVNLGERPMKTSFGMRTRPHFEIVGWKTPGDDARAFPAKPSAPQLTGPAAAPAETTSAPSAPAASAPASTSPTTTPGSPALAPAPPRQPKPAVKLASETLAAMSDVKPVTLGEILNDEVPW